MTVLAAASLSDAFRQVGADYQRRHPDVHVTFSFAGSQTLVAQVREGISADVLATADEPTMAAAKADLGSAAAVFAHNRLVIAVPRANPKHVRGLSDLSHPDLAVVLADPAVPAGRYAQTALTAARVTVHPRSLEDNVRSVLTKVRLGEADAGIVYASDVAATHGALAAIPIADAPVASYPVAVLAAGHRAAAAGFVAFLLSAEGQAVLRADGFEPAR